MSSHPTHTWFDEVHATTGELVVIPSISPDSPGENRCAERIARLLRQESDLEPILWPTGDGRHNVASLLRGAHREGGSRTLILLSHYDTVGVEEFRALDPDAGRIAFDPPRLARRLKEEAALPGDASELFMFGRGALDMKSGVAIQIAVMRRLWQERADLGGNVLFLSCPDEENESLGILTALPHLQRLQEEEGLSFIGAINADYTAPRGADEAARTVYSGTVGKLLPAFYITGQTTHVGEPFRGVDAGEIAAELVRRLNLNSDLADSWSGAGALPPERAAPPMTLKVRDLKSSYNVQTAPDAFVYANWLTYTLTPAAALEKMEALATGALKAVLEKRAEEFAAFTARGGETAPPEEVPLTVLSFAALWRQLLESGRWADEAALDAWLDGLADRLRLEVAAVVADPARLASGLALPGDSRELSRLLVSALVQEAGIRPPAIIVFFAPPYYPHIAPQENELTGALRQVLAPLAQTEPEEAQRSPLREKFRNAVPDPATPPVELRGFYPYISDMSYLHLDESIRADLPALRSNMPLFGRGYGLDLEAVAQLQVPVANVGPWGKDAHGLTERVHMPYAFEVVPQIIYETARHLLMPRHPSNE